MIIVATQFANIRRAVKRISRIVGGILNSLADSFRRPAKIELLQVRHEEVAGQRGRGLIHHQQIKKANSDLADDNTVFACDVGLPTLCVADYLEMNGRRRLIDSFSRDSTANAMGQALSFPSRLVVSLWGDGGITTLMGDLIILARLESPLEVTILNNESLGFLAVEKNSTGLQNFGAELKESKFVGALDAGQIRRIRFEASIDTFDGLASAFADEGPVLAHAVLNPAELAAPAAIAPATAKCFTLYIVET